MTVDETGGSTIEKASCVTRDGDDISGVTVVEARDVTRDETCDVREDEIGSVTMD